MSLPPERISVKRRRLEEPVEALCTDPRHRGPTFNANSFLLDLEQDTGTGPEKKRRVTEFYFQRIRIDAVAAVAAVSQSQGHDDARASQAVWSKPPAPGVPPIRLTSLENPQNVSSKPREAVEANSVPIDQEKDKKSQNANAGDRSKSVSPAPGSSQAARQARRFHLARSISSVLSPNTTGGIRKPKNFIRPPLATFIERQGAALNAEQNPMYRGKPVDKMLEVPGSGDQQNEKTNEDKEPTIDTLNASKRNPVSTFIQPRPKTVRNGTSIRDDPSTWDLESDQLADELAALAMELDPELQQKAKAEPSLAPLPTSSDVVMTSHEQEDDYIYETYVRIPYDGDTALESNYGILVIDEEDQDLWQKYVDSEDDTDWDEEDSNGKYRIDSLPVF